MIRTFLAAVSLLSILPTGNSMPTEKEMRGVVFGVPYPVLPHFQQVHS